MNIDKIPYADFEEFKQDAHSAKLREKIDQYLYHWPLFLLSIAICLSLAFVYLKFSQPLYSIKAKLLIKITPSTESSLSERDLFKGTKMIENELEILKSRTLIKQVVSDLQLWINYQMIGEFRTTDIYGSTPVRFTLLTPLKPLAGQMIEIKIIDEKSFILKQPHSESKLFFASAFRNNYGTWKLNKTENLKSYIGSTIRITLNNPDETTHNYMGAVNLKLSKDEGTVVDLNIMDYVPERAQDILNRLIVVYNLAAIADKNKVAESSLRFIEDRLASITGELNSVEKDVEGYKSSRGLTDIASKSQIYLNNVKDNDAKINEVQLQLQVVNEIERFINSSESSGMAPATVGITDPVLLGLIDKLMNLESQRDKLLATIPEGNPIFQPINRQITTTKNSISENIKGIKSALRVTEKELNNFNSSFKASIREIPGQEREYISIKRQQSIKEDLYIYLLQKREESAVSYASTVAGSRVVDPAYFVGMDAINKANTYTLAFIFGLMFPGGLIFIRDLINNRIKSRKEIQAQIDAPILGELCFQKFTGSFVVQNSPGRIIGEQFRALRTNLKYVHGKTKNGKVTLLTSGMSGDGKSFVTINLGVALANAGRKTIILELDFRKPSIIKSLNLECKVGMSNYLIGQATREEIIQPSTINPNLFVVATGPLPPNPSELLEATELEELISWLKMNFDEILIDTPPILLVTDALILTSFSDANLYVVRYGYTYKAQLELLNQLYKEQKVPKLNIIFNGVESKGTGYGYGYYTKQENFGMGEELQNFLKRF